MMDKYKVINVIDGDTFVIMYKGQREKVRILGIDTPERKKPGYAAASNHLRKLIDSKTVELEFQTLKADRDHYQRLLCNVYLVEDNIVTDIGKEMLTSGHAKVYKRGEH